MTFFKKLFYTPIQSTHTISTSSGFHLRPIAQFVAIAKEYTCDIVLLSNKRRVSAKSINDVLSLSLEQHHTFTLICHGKDAPQASLALKNCFILLMKHEPQLMPKQNHKETHHYQGNILEAETLASGIAIAPLYYYEEKRHFSGSPHSFEEALAQSLKELSLFTPNNQGIYLAQKALLLSLAQEVQGFKAFEHKLNLSSQALKGTKLEAKQSDYQDILQRMQKHLGIEIEVSYPSTPFILLADDLLPSHIEALKDTAVKGVILKETSPLSHTAILLRASGIPSVIANIQETREKQEILLDAFAQIILIDPSKEDKEQALKRLKKSLKEKNIAHERRFENAHTKQNKVIKVLANIGDIASAQEAREAGAEGIGLLRSEFLFKSLKPTLEAQIQAYQTIFSLFDDITVRTLDIGGDKNLPYISIPIESNPFLGIRGVRLFRTHPHILEEQILAIFKASKQQKIKIMFPMVSSVEEFNKAKTFSLNIAKKHHLDISHIAFGIMIEVPSVLFLLSEFNKVVDFYSIGTNDLSQYLFATERTHPLLKIDALSPVIFSAIEMIESQVNKPLSICGELASNSKALKKLLDLEIKILSVTVNSIAQIKEEIRGM